MRKSLAASHRSHAAVHFPFAHITSAFEDAVVGMVLFDLDNRRIRANEAYAEFLGYTLEELDGLDFRGLVHPDELRVEDGLRAELRAGTRESYHREKRYLHRDGRVLWGEFTCRLVRDGRGRPQHYIGQVLDITARKRAEDELQQLRAELEARVRERTHQLELAAAEQEAFAASIAHDLRNPLTSLAGYSALLQRSLANPEAAPAHYLARIHGNVQRMGELTEALLSLPRLATREIERRPVDLGAAARHVLERLRAAEPLREVDIRVEDGLHTAGDPALLPQLMACLLDNAWKFSRHKGLTRIEVGRRAQDDGRAAFFVRDHGIGFDPAFAGKLFLPFSRLHGEAGFEGTGTGLALARRIVERHGGRIRAEGEAGRGATFVFTLA